MFKKDEFRTLEILGGIRLIYITMWVMFTAMMALLYKLQYIKPTDEFITERVDEARYAVGIASRKIMEEGD